MSDEKYLGNLEEELMFSLNPVEPRREFISRLKHQLVTPSEVTIDKPSRLNQFLPAVAGILGGILLIWVIRRIFSHITKLS